MTTEPDAATHAVLRCRLLGAPAWSVDGITWHALTRKDAALLALLALEGPQSRERLSGLLWPDVPQARANANLRQRLFRLRHDSGQAIVEAGEVVALLPQVQTDLLAFAEGARDAVEASHVTPPPDDDDLLGGFDFTPDGEGLATWVAQSRTRWRQRRVDMLTGLAARQEATGQIAAALATVERLLALDPLPEHAWRRLMRLHEARGDRAAAVASFERCERVLRDELGLAPGAETIELLMSIERAEGRQPAGRALPPALLRPPACVGREREFAQMHAAWHGGRAFLLIGDAGLGKSRLLADLAASTPHCLLGLARPGDELVPFGTLVRVLRQALVRDGLQLPNDARSELARLLPELGPAPVAAAEPQAMARAVDAALAAVRGQGLRALLIDDLHHADDATLGALRAQMALTEPAGLALGFTTRPLGRADGARLPTELLTDSVRAVPIPLPPLTHEALVALLEATLAGLPKSALPTDTAHLALIDRLARHCGGNPLFALETLKELWLGGLGPTADSLPLPASVGALLGQRLRRLSPRSTDLLRVAAVAGPDFSPDIASHVLNSAPRPVAARQAPRGGMRKLGAARRFLTSPPWALADAWAELQALQLLDTDGLVPPLVADVVREGLPRPLRRPLHGRIAEALNAEGGPAEREAQHHAEAGAWAEAAQASLRASRSAWTLGHRQAELAHARRAAQWFDQAGQAAAAFDARLSSVQACLAVEGIEAADRLTTDLLAQARAPEAGCLIGPRQLVGALSERSSVVGDQGDLDTSIALGEEALALTEPADPQGMQVRLALAQCLALVGQADRATAMMAEVLALAEPGGDTLLRCDLWSGYAYALNYANRRREAVQALRRTLALAVEIGSPQQELVALTNLTVQHAVLGQQAEAIETGLRARERARRVGTTLDMRNNEVNLAMFLAGAGRFEEALAMLHEVHAHALKHASGTALQHCAEDFLAETWLLLGRPDRAREVLGDAMVDTLPPVRRAFRADLLARLAAMDGGAAAALPLGRAAVAWAAQATPMPTRLRALLNTTLWMPAEEALAACAEAHAEASAHEYPPGVMLARLRQAQALARSGRAGESAEAARAVLAMHPQVQHVFVPVPQWAAAVADLLDAAAAAPGAAAARAAGCAWIDVALPNVPREGAAAFAAFAARHPAPGRSAAGRGRRRATR